MPSSWIEKRNNNYRVVWRLPSGKRAHQECGPFRQLAVEYKSRKDLELRGQAAGLTSHINLTWTEFEERYRAYARTTKAKNTVEHFDFPTLQSFRAYAGDTFLSSITPAQIEAWRVSLSAKYHQNTVRIFTRCIKAAFNYAVRMEYLIKSPAQAVSLPRAVPVGRTVSDEELRLICSEMPPDIRRFVLFLPYTGFRKGEALGLRYERIFQDGNGSYSATLDGADTKTRRARVVPLHPAAVQLISPIQSSGSVFPNITSNMVQHYLREARIKHKLGRIRLHDLRHTFATRYLEEEGDLADLMAVAGMRSLTTAAQYTHISKATSVKRLARVHYNVGDLPPYCPPKRGGRRKNTGNTETF